MKKARIVSIVLIIALVISTSVFATNTRASDQLIKYSANANIEEGNIDFPETASVYSEKCESFI